MKVLFQLRSDYRKNPAGDTVQLLGTAQALQKLGVQIFISADPHIKLSEYDLVHIFNATRASDASMYIENAKRQKKPVVLSPIYWNMQKYLEQQDANSMALRQWEEHQPWRAQLLRDSDLLLPNGQLEMDMIREDFQINTPYQVIPNGFPEEYLTVDETLFREKCPGLPDQFVLSIARISPRKNQVLLARYCHELGLTLVLAGPINDPSYFEQVQSYSNVIYLGTLQGHLLASAYAAAKIHALPSWFETPGLSSLEAGACGAVVLSTDQGSTTEYFKDMAVYMNPFQEASLKTALEASLDFSPEPLMNHIRHNFTWSKVGELTFAAYQTVLSKN